MAEHLIPSDPVLGAALQANTAAGLPAYDVTPNQAININQKLVKEKYERFWTPPRSNSATNASSPASVARACWSTRKARSSQ
jgi:hypothetical protein